MTHHSDTPGTRLWIVGPRQARTIGQSLGPGVEWCYLGSNMTERAAVARSLAHLDVAPISEDLNRIAYDTKQPFLDWCASIGSRHTNALTWWGSRTASKSPFQTDLFFLVCYCRLVQSWA